MYSATNKKNFSTAAWRISLWGTLAFSAGALIVFFFLNYYVSKEIQSRSDAWLAGEIDVLSDVARNTPQNDLHDRIVDEVAELATKEVPSDPASKMDWNEAVFFLQTDSAQQVKLWVGKGDSAPYFTDISQGNIVAGKLADIQLPSYKYPYRVASYQTGDGSTNYLGLSERNDQRVLRHMRNYLIGICLLIVVLGFLLIFFTTKEMLSRVQGITETASHIGQDDLTSRVPAGKRHDEISQLAATLNRMLDRIQATVRQLHTMTDSLSHDLRSPIMAVRGKLETALLAAPEGEWTEPMADALVHLDRVSDLLTKSLDVAEANANALRLRPESVRLDKMLQSMIDLYEPAFAEHQLMLGFTAPAPVHATLDAGLVHRMLANLMDNCLRHLPAGTQIQITLTSSGPSCKLSITDNGPGFPEAILPRIFDKYAKGEHSTGSGLGLAFVEAVVRAHQGSVSVANQPHGGAQIEILMACQDSR